MLDVFDLNISNIYLYPLVIEKTLFFFLLRVKRLAKLLLAPREPDWESFPSGKLSPNSLWMRLQLALLVNVGAQELRAAPVCFEPGSCCISYRLVRLEEPAKHCGHLEETARNMQSIQMGFW